MGLLGIEISLRLTSARRRTRQRVSLHQRRRFNRVERTYATIVATGRLVVLVACLLSLSTGSGEARPRGERDHDASLAATATVEPRSVGRGGTQIGDLENRLTLAQRSDAPSSASAPPSVGGVALSRTPAAETERQRTAAESLASELTSPLRAELNAVQSAAERERIKQTQALEQERHRTNELARELAAVRAELDAAERIRAHTMHAIEVGIQQAQALDEEREKASNLAGELSFLKAELVVAQLALSRAIQEPEAKVTEDRFVENRDKYEMFAPVVASLGMVFAAAPPGAPAVIAPTAEIQQKQALERQLADRRDKAEALARELTSVRTDLDAARKVASEAAEARSAEIEQKQALEQQLKQKRDEADAAASQLTSLQAELDTARTAASEATKASAAEAQHGQALERELNQQRSKTDAVAAELSSLRVEFDTARTAAAKAVTADAAQRDAIERESEKQRSSAEALAGELTSLRGELDVARTSASTAAKANATEVEQKQALERELGQQRDRVDALARETASLKKQLDAARTAAPETTRTAATEAARTVDAARGEAGKALDKERVKTETLSRELASERKLAEERSTRLAAAYAEMLQVTEANNTTAAEQKQALVNERQRADTVTAELASVRTQLEAANRKLGALNASRRHTSRKPGVDSPQHRVAVSTPATIEEKPRVPEQPALSSQERSSALEAPPAARVSPPERDAKGAVSAPAGAALRPLVDEQRLLVRANALLRQADVGGARQLLELALEHGSSRAAFMLAETYDPRVLQSWRARGLAGDSAKARVLYERAQTGGIEDARERIKTLK